jgi:hypothetical protein
MDASLFVRRPVAAIVLSLVILLLGAVAFTQLPVRETPDVQSPVVTVSTAWPGADPSLVETQVTEVLERQLNGIEGVRQITSTSQDQSSTITVEFELGRELEAAANDVRSRVSRARRSLPDEVDEPVVEKADSNAQPVMFLRVASKTRSLLELNEIGDTLVRERLQSATGVSGVDIFGEQRFAMRVELDPAKLAARNLTPADVEAAFRAQNVNLPAGRVEAGQLGARQEGDDSFLQGLRGLPPGPAPRWEGLPVVLAPGRIGEGLVDLPETGVCKSLGAARIGVSAVGTGPESLGNVQHALAAADAHAGVLQAGLAGAILAGRGAVWAHGSSSGLRFSGVTLTTATSASPWFARRLHRGLQGH